MTKKLHIGEITIDRIVEQEGPFLSALDIFPSPSLGCMTRWGEGFRCEALEG